MNDLNQTLTAVLGVEYDWQHYIASITQHAASQFTKSAIFDDILTDVTADLYFAAKDGKLTVALVKAKDEAKDDAELLSNVKGVVMQATKFRASDARRKYQKRMGVVQFSQLEKVEETVAQREQTDASEYEALLVRELDLMAQSAEWTKKPWKSWAKLAKRYRLAATIVPDRLQGWGFDDLMKRHNVKSSSTMAAIMDDIELALARVAGKLQDPTLLKGTAGVKVG